ncbi:hypothetical protein Mro02_20790 [Microbispora rosea subsp. aerata]|nr:hypothetical protein Mro02_20790 [Microbispora rosea subsp. aerata]GLJ82615.1 hypothetical protein GCM10017588_13400 [Microbispora rosea subsp. aerata]
MLAVLVAAGLAVAAVWLLLDLRRLRAAERAAGEALAAARSYAPDMLSYDYRTIERDMLRAGAHATGQLAEHYRTLAKTLGPQARERKTVQHAVVAAAGVESATPEEVRVLLFVNVVTTRSGPGQKGPKQQVSQGRARLVMVTQGDGWKAARLSTLLGDTPVP